VFRLAWGVTGAGHFMKETLEVFLQLKKEFKVAVTVFLSRAGEEVARMYGVFEQLRKVAPGGYYQEVVLESEEGASFPKAGRFASGKYYALIVSPATSNTVAKMVFGICDTLVTTAFAQAMKSAVPVYVVPTDYDEGEVETTLPVFVDRDVCLGCSVCPPEESCPRTALVRVEGKPMVNLLKCVGCLICVNKCPHGAIIFGRRVKARVRKVDAENVKRLSEMDGVHVLKHPREIIPCLRRDLKF